MNAKRPITSRLRPVSAEYKYVAFIIPSKPALTYYLWSANNSSQQSSQKY